MFTKALRKSNAKWVDVSMQADIDEPLPRLAYMASPSPSSVPPVIIFSRSVSRVLCSSNWTHRRVLSPSPTLPLFTCTPL
ncbi:unnamed protein product [Rodentolepis nana]|uniref:Uncharacterized protein n=1 Tax=Rodentolepis nana TaxID=102285 RepID=A0A0R3THD0_RODNA|nr:unnamed protein product [Rodentolepis nana]